jgi:hypothetical protein
MSLSAGGAAERFLAEAEVADTLVVAPRDFLPVVAVADLPIFLVAVFAALADLPVFLVAVFAALADLPAFLVAVFVAIRTPINCG